MADRSAKLWLVHFKYWRERGRLSLNVMREICAYLTDPLLISVNDTFLSFFHCGSLTWEPWVQMCSPTQVSKYSSWTMLQDGRALCSGGRFPYGSREVYLLSRDGAVDLLPDMHTARVYHGVIQVLHLYVFGGFNSGATYIAEALKVCDKMDLSSGTWSVLPDMREGRGLFNPCLWSGTVYLCGNGSLLLEAFSPLSDSFLPLTLQLPESTPCCVYVHNHCLVVHSTNYITQFTPGQLLSQVPSKDSVSKWSNSQPVVDSARSCFFLIQCNKCMCFHMETGHLISTY